jgi:hypothetical protein
MPLVAYACRRTLQPEAKSVLKWQVEAAPVLLSEGGHEDGLDRAQPVLGLVEDAEPAAQAA